MPDEEANSGSSGAYLYSNEDYTLTRRSALVILGENLLGVDDRCRRRMQSVLCLIGQGQTTWLYDCVSQ